MPERMDSNWLAKLGRCPCVSACPLQHARVEWPALVLAWKQPMRRPGFPPIGAQNNEELRRQHDVAVPTALALFDPDQHAGAVDVGEFQVHDLGDSEPGGIGGHQRCSVFQTRHCCQKPGDFLGAQDHRQLPALACIGNSLDHRGAPERDAVKEAQGADRYVKSGPRDANRGEVDLI